MSSAKKKIASFLLIFTFLVLPVIGMTTINQVSADDELWDSQIGIETVGEEAYGETGEPQDIRVTVVKVINLILTFIAIIFFIFIVLAGYRWMTAGGNEEQVSKAKRNITNALIGLVITFMSWGITYFLLRTMVKISGNEIDYLHPYY